MDSLWDKFQNSPTITGLDSDYHSWDVPFPGLTLCLQNPTNETLVETYVDEKWPDANDEQKMYYSKFLRTLTNVSFAALPNLLPFVSDESLPQTDLRQLSFSLYSHCHAFVQCAYKASMEDDQKDCCTLLYPVFTENGFCFAFNLNYSATDWPWNANVPPFSEDFIEETDARWSFTFDTDDPVNNSVAVYITSSFDLPGADINPQHIWNKRVSKLMFVPKMTYTADGADQLSMRQRGCVFSNEIKLRVAPFYTFSSCVRQCRMDTLAKRCGCLPMFYTLLPGQRYCELRELKCIIESLDLLSAARLKCPCQLGCEHTVYDMEKPHEAGGEAGGEGQDTVGVEVGFLSWPLTRYKRDVLFGRVDLLVAIGTIAGLFLGFSLLSGLEIIYLFTMRAWCMMYTDRQHLEDLAEEYSRREKDPVDLSLRPGFLKQGAVAGLLVVAPATDAEDAPGAALNQGPPLWRRTNPVVAAKNNKNNAAALYPYAH